MLSSLLGRAMVSWGMMTILHYSGLTTFTVPLPPLLIYLVLALAAIALLYISKLCCSYNYSATLSYTFYALQQANKVESQKIFLHKFCHIPPLEKQKKKKNRNAIAHPQSHP